MTRLLRSAFACRGVTVDAGGRLEDCTGGCGPGPTGLSGECLCKAGEVCVAGVQVSARPSRAPDAAGTGLMVVTGLVCSPDEP